MTLLLDHGADVENPVVEVNRYGVLLDGRVRGVYLVLYVLDISCVSILICLEFIAGRADRSPYGH